MKEGERGRLAARQRASGRPVDEAAILLGSLWRESAGPGNLRLLDFYGAYLVGQYAGMGDALSLDAVRAALDIEGVAREDWPDMTERLLCLHSVVVENLPEK